MLIRRGREFPAKVCSSRADITVLNYAKHHSGYTLEAGRRALLCATAVLLASGGHAAQSRTQMSVNATVLPVARLQVTSAPTDIQLSAEDLRRGYIDVPQPTALVVNSNSSDGFALDLMTLSPLATSIIVNGLEADQSLSAEGGTLTQRWQRPQAMRVTLRFRLMLAPGLQAGRYTWPVKLGVRPL